MNLEQFGEELKQIRLRKEISLLDISAETRINLKFLEAVESGQFHILPQTYIRAFLREYALVLGTDPQVVLQQYDTARAETFPKKSDEPAPPQVPAAPTAGDNKYSLGSITLSPLQRNIVFGGLAVVVLVLVVLLVNPEKLPESPKAVREVPFDRVVRESEAASPPPAAVVRDSVPALRAGNTDSLRLQITTLDSVWVHLLIDDTKAQEYLFGPNRKRTFRAKDRFVITMGNAGAATFQLNGKDLGPLGKQGAVVRNAVITEARLKK